MADDRDENIEEEGVEKEVEEEEEVGEVAQHRHENQRGRNFIAEAALTSRITHCSTQESLSNKIRY